MDELTRLTAPDLLDRVMSLDAVAAEIYSKEGFSLRIAATGEHALAESVVEESGVAVRAWGRRGSEVFGTFIRDEPVGAVSALRRIRECLSEPGSCDPPALPASPPAGGRPRFPGPLRETVLRETREISGRFQEIRPAFSSPIREAVRMEGAWLEAGASRDRLVNSNGFDAEREEFGWNLSLAARAAGSGDTRVGYLGRSGSRAEEFDPGTLVSEVCWRTAAPLGGEGVGCGRAAVVVDTALASDLLRSLGGLFTASEETVEALRRGDRMGPDDLRLDEIPLEPDAPGWDGEGVARGRVRIVDGGRLVGLLTDLHSSRRFDLPATGSARRPSFRDGPLAEPSRLVMSLGESEESHEELLGRLAPGLFLTTGRLLRAETGPGGALVGAGIWLDGGRVVRAVRGAVIPFRPLGLLRSICGSDSPQAWTRGSECGCLLINPDISPA